MNPLLFVNWYRVHRRFRALMWILASVLAIVVLFHAVPTQAENSHAVQRPAPLLTSPVKGHAKSTP